ncbi:MAG: hypothetical protein U0840_11750 [Gemmataceae bacterium]
MTTPDLEASYGNVPQNLSYYTLVSFCLDLRLLALVPSKQECKQKET